MGAKTRKKLEKKQIEDRTFGLKNKKKSKKVQKYVKQVANKLSGGNNGKSEQQLLQEAFEAKKRKKEQAKQDAMLKQMFGGSKKERNKSKKKKKKDPKNMICPYFKVGLCGKGDSCKFSHDLEKEAKTSKINLYYDPRDPKNLKGGAGAPKKPLTKEEDVIDLWDSEKLHEVIRKKQLTDFQSNNLTKGVCNEFLKAVEGGKYGWFWKCPNGKDCQYRHALPPGYVLKKDRAVAKSYDDEERPLHDVLEEERTKIFMKGDGTKVAKDSLEALWSRIMKKKAVEEKRRLAELSAKEKKKKNQKKKMKKLTGKQLFMQDPTLWKIEEDDEADDLFESQPPAKNGKTVWHEIAKAPDVEENGQPTASPEVEQKDEKTPAEPVPVPENVEINEDVFLDDDDIDLPDDIE